MSDTTAAPHVPPFSTEHLFAGHSFNADLSLTKLRGGRRQETAAAASFAGTEVSTFACGCCFRYHATHPEFTTRCVFAHSSN